MCWLTKGLINANLIEQTELAELAHTRLMVMTAVLLHKQVAVHKVTAVPG